MSGLTPYIHFPGTAREALSFYAEVLGGAILQRRAWSAIDGQAIDRYGVHWPVGFEADPDA